MLPIAERAVIRPLARQATSALRWALSSDLSDSE
jgi:transposase